MQGQMDLLFRLGPSWQFDGELQGAYLALAAKLKLDDLRR